MAAPFSAIIMVGALVLPGGDRRLTEASMTRSRSTPATPKTAVNDHRRIAGKAHLGGADGMKDRRADVARGFRQRVVVVADRCARQVFVRMKRR